MNDFSNIKIQPIDYDSTYINNQMKNNMDEYIADCEQKYNVELKKVSDDIVSRSNCKIIMLAGPSGSGKTTTANLLADNFTRHGLNTTVLSIDDFYLPGDQSPVDENGKRDYETVYAIDIELVRKTLVKLLTDGECMIPKYLFGSSERIENHTKVTLAKNDMIIIEGLHALNPLFTDGLNLEGILKIYIAPGGNITKDGHILINDIEVRLMRRLVRDRKFRSASPQLTFDMWGDVVKAEAKYIDPFICESDYYIPTLHGYEVSMIGKEAVELLQQIETESMHYNYACEILQKLKSIDLYTCEKVPFESLLREFLGNGKFN